MDFEFSTLELSGAYMIRPMKYVDNCGYKFCIYDSDILSKSNFDIDFKKSTVYYSEFKSLRGIYYEKKPFNSLLLNVLSGSITVVVVDLRHDYETFYKYIKLEMTSDDACSLLIPRGCAYGFLTLSDYSCVEIKSDGKYSFDNLCVLSWNDCELNIDWGVDYLPIVCNDVASEKLS